MRISSLKCLVSLPGSTSLSHQNKPRLIDCPSVSTRYGDKCEHTNTRTASAVRITKKLQQHVRSPMTGNSAIPIQALNAQSRLINFRTHTSSYQRALRTLISKLSGKLVYQIDEG